MVAVGGQTVPSAAPSVIIDTCPMEKQRSERPWLIFLILAFALTNGVLYALLMPLWEGFDEPYHYGYVQELSVHNRLPALGTTSLSLEVWDSLLLVPVSHVVQRNIPVLMTFGEYFRSPEGER